MSYREGIDLTPGGFPYRQSPHQYCGSNSDRQGVGDPGHCEDCCAVGHIVAHPDLGCGDVQCYSDHDDKPTSFVEHWNARILREQSEAAANDRTLLTVSVRAVGVTAEAIYGGPSYGQATMRKAEVALTAGGPLVVADELDALANEMDKRPVSSEDVRARAAQLRGGAR